MAKTSPGRRKFVFQFSGDDPQVPPPAHFEGAEVTGIGVGTAPDGGDVITVDWRGSSTVVNGYARSYTPRAIGDDVILIVQSNKVVIFDVIRGVM